MALNFSCSEISSSSSRSTWGDISCNMTWKDMMTWWTYNLNNSHVIMSLEEASIVFALTFFKKKTSRFSPNSKHFSLDLLPNIEACSFYLNFKDFTSFWSLKDFTSCWSFITDFSANSARASAWKKLQSPPSSASSSSASSSSVHRRRRHHRRRHHWRRHHRRLYHRHIHHRRRHCWRRRHRRRHHHHQHQIVKNILFNSLHHNHNHHRHIFVLM